MNDVTNYHNYITVPGIERHTFVKIITLLTFKLAFIGELLYTNAVGIFMSWAIGFFTFNTGSIIPILLVFAFVTIMYNDIRSERVNLKESIL